LQGPSDAGFWVWIKTAMGAGNFWTGLGSKNCGFFLKKFPWEILLEKRRGRRDPKNPEKSCNFRECGAPMDSDESKQRTFHFEAVEFFFKNQS
jgi:hypothetical protein